MRNKDKHPELLAPAGSPEALDAAIEAGADAVYFGGEQFSNRMRAQNFNSAELVRSIEKCAAYSVESHITINTRLRDSELPYALRLAENLYEAGADAFIVADAGLARLIHERMPQAVMHASTQMTGVSSSDAAALSRLGFSRMVCPREISKDELLTLTRNSPIEIEMFIHGAHCVSVSGQCLMSWAMGGRSGNRGECAQPCRLPYTADSDKRSEEHLLSLRDMCLAQHIPEITASGVSSLKIEGRLKSPDYVYGVTKIYRRLLDENRAATPAEICDLEEIFSRGGFTDGYFRGDMRAMNGIRTEDNRNRAKNVPKEISKKLPITAHAFLKCGEMFRLTFSYGEYSVTCEGGTLQAANKAPLDRASIYKNVSKLGSTPYSLKSEDFCCNIEGNVFLNAASINDIRRRAASELEKLIISSKKRELPRKTPKNAGTQKNLKSVLPHIRTAEFLKAENIPDEAFSYFDVIFLPLRELKGLPIEKFAQNKLGLSFSPYTDDPETESSVSFCVNHGIKYVQVHTVSQVTAAFCAGMITVASFRLNVMNTEAAKSIAHLGADYVILSPELPRGALRDIPRSLENEFLAGAVVYGALPLMLLKRCILNVRTPCSHECMVKGCDAMSFIKDRKGIKLPVYAIGDGLNSVFNPSVIWSAESCALRENFGISHFIFTSEKHSEIIRVIASYKNGCEPPPGMPIKRL